MPTSSRSSRLARLLRYVGRSLAYAALAAGALFCLMLLALRFFFFPRIDDFRPHIEQGLSRAMGQPIAIERASPAWDGWNPRLVLSGLHVRDREGRGVLELPLVDAVVSWRWMLLGQLRMKALTIDEPDLVIRRDRDGRLHVAGARIDPGAPESDSAVGDWLLRQRVVAIRNGAVTWIDEARAAPALRLQRVEFRLENGLGHHRFGLTGAPPAELASPLDLRGDFRGDSLSGPERLRGRVYLRLDYADIAAWRRWLPIPVDVVAGSGGVRLWIDVGRDAIGEVAGEFDVADVVLQVAQSRPTLAFGRLAGRVTTVEQNAQREFRFAELALRMVDGATVAPIDGLLRVDQQDPPRVVEAQMAIGAVDLAAAASLARALALSPAIHEALSAHAPSGVLEGARIRWQADSDGKGPAYSISGRLKDATLAPHHGIPGLSRANGSFELTDKGGSLQVAGVHGRLELPDVFIQALHLDTVSTRAGWKRDGQALMVRIDELAMANADLAASLSGELRLAAGASAWVDLNGTVARADARQVWRYLPRAVDEPVRRWVQDALLAGDVGDVRIRWKGGLADFPYAVDPARGDFRVALAVSAGELRYATDWPAIDTIRADVLLDRNRLTVTAQDGRILGVPIGPVVASLPILGVEHPVLRVEGEANGASREFLRFVAATPVASWIDHATDGFEVSGDGRLALRLDIPLRHDAATRVAGEFKMRDNRLQLGSGLPTLDKVTGTLSFSEREIAARDLAVELLGSPALVSVATTDGRLRVGASGSVDVAHAMRAFAVPGADLVSGRSDWRLAVDVAERSVSSWELTMPLRGASIDLPPPLGKAAETLLPLRVERRLLPPRRERLIATLGAGDRPLAQLQLIRSTADSAPVDAATGATGGAAAAMLPEAGKAKAVEPVPASAAAGSLESALLLLGQAHGSPPRAGLWIAADLPTIDADRWIEWWERQSPAAEATATVASAATPAPPRVASAAAGRPLVGGLALGGFELRTPTLKLLGRTVNDVAVKASTGAPWKAELEARQLAGRFEWQPQRADSPRHGTLTARLTHLDLGGESDDAADARPPGTGAPNTPSQPRDWPAVDLIADSLVSRERQLGRLEVRGGPRGNDWQVEGLRLGNPDGDLDVQGWWRGGHTQRTEVAVVLTVRDPQAYLRRYGYPDAVRGAATTIRGDASWPGGLRDVDYTTMSGVFRIDTQAGQFTRVDPGIGKLLGVLSLQALPRRAALDFRDVFSEGFAFDSLSGTVKLDNGVMATADLRFAGPGARVELAGEADLRDETQRLDVRMYPSLSTGVAVGAAIVNPLAGAAVLLGQKILQDPFDKLFAMTYRVTGSWADPQVTRVPSFGGVPGSRAEDQPR